MTNHTETIAFWTAKGRRHRRRRRPPQGRRDQKLARPTCRLAWGCCGARKRSSFDEAWFSISIIGARSVALPRGLHWMASFAMEAPPVPLPTSAMATSMLGVGHGDFLAAAHANMCMLCACSGRAQTAHFEHVRLQSSWRSMPQCISTHAASCTIHASLSGILAWSRQEHSAACGACTTI